MCGYSFKFRYKYIYRERERKRFSNSFPRNSPVRVRLALPRARPSTRPRPMRVADIRTELCNGHEERAQATVKITALPDEWGSRMWAGHAAGQKEGEP